MSDNNVENLVSVDEINVAIEQFIGKHPENVSIWVDGKTSIIQISNIGIRDKLFYRLAYLVENTTIEDNLTIFNMPAKCVIANNRIARFVCTVNELVEFIESQNTSGDAPGEDDESGGLVLPSIKKFSNRLSSSHAFKRAQEIINQETNDDSSKITVYVISNPESHSQDEEGNTCNYVTWKVIGIIKIEAGTTWEDETFRERLNTLKESSNVASHLGSYGAFNINFDNNSRGENIIFEDDKFVGMRPEFVFDSSIKVGDIIDSRNYNDSDIWSEYDDYQTDTNEYPKFESFGEDTLNDNDTPFKQTLIPDGAIITI